MIEVLRRPVESALDAVVGVDDQAGIRVAVADGHVERVRDQRRGLGGVDRPADDAPGVGVQDDGAVHLALAGAVFGDVGDPQLVASVAVEHPMHQVTS